MINQEETELTKITRLIDETASEMYNTLAKNEYYIIEIVTLPDEYAKHFFKEKSEKKGKFLDIYLDDKYAEEYSEKLDIQINRILLKHKEIEHIKISSFDYKMPTKLSLLFKNLTYIKDLSIRDYLYPKEYKNIEALSNLEALKLDMWNASDTDFTKLKNLKKCLIIMGKGQSSNEEIKSSKKYIKQLQKENPNIEFDLRID